jgi:hypothetical protein
MLAWLVPAVPQFGVSRGGRIALMHRIAVRGCTLVDSRSGSSSRNR